MVLYQTETYYKTIISMTMWWGGGNRELDPIEQNRKSRVRSTQMTMHVSAEKVDPKEFHHGM